MAQSLETDYSSSMEDAQENPHQALRSSHFSHEIPEKNEYSPIDSSSYFQLLQLWKKDPPDSIGTNSKGQEKHIHIPNKVKLSLSFGTILFLAGCAPGVVGGVAAVPGENISMNGSDGKNVAITEIMPQPSENAVSSTQSEVSTYTIGVTNADITPSSTQSVKKTEIAPSLTPLTQEVSPTPTATEIQPSATQESITPTATVTEIEQGDWFDEHFLPEEQLPEGAILMNNLTREQVQKLTITGPGQVLGRCPFKSFQKKLTEGRIISSVHIDLTQKNGNFCVFGTTREKTIRNGIATKFSTLSPVDQDVLANKYIRKLKIFEEKILNLGYDPIIDLFENFTFQYVYNEKGEPYDVNMFIYNNPNPPTGEWPLREVIDIPLSEPTATTTP